MTKQELSEALREKVKELNVLINEANELKLKASVSQKFHPLSNYFNGIMNPPLNISITEEISY